MTSEPAHIGRYLLEQEIGRGGAGTVWRARDPVLQRAVAIKLMSVGLLGDRDESQRFIAEARAIARLVHQNIVVLYDYGAENGKHWLAMQCVEGVSLAKRVAQGYITNEGETRYGIGFEKTIEIARQILRALKYAHGLNLLHRDVKSSNILLDEAANQALLGDFGIALIQDTERLTTEGVALGTPEYMSPEQCQGHPLDKRSDLYSLGIVLYECLTGKPPFLAEEPLAIAYKHVHEPAPIDRPEIPSPMRRILHKALAKRPEDRYKDADEMLEAFDALTGGKKTPSRGTPAYVEPDDQRMRRDRRLGDRRHGSRRDTEQSLLPWYEQRGPVLWLIFWLAILQTAQLVLLWALYQRK